MLGPHDRLARADRQRHPWLIRHLRQGHRQRGAIGQWVVDGLGPAARADLRDFVEQLAHHDPILGRLFGIRMPRHARHLRIRELGQQHLADRGPADRTQHAHRVVDALRLEAFQAEDEPHVDALAQPDHDRLPGALAQLLHHGHEAALAEQFVLQPRAQQHHAQRGRVGPVRWIEAQKAQRREARQQHTGAGLRIGQRVGHRHHGRLPQPLREQLEDLQHAARGLDGGWLGHGSMASMEWRLGMALGGDDLISHM